jgi:hypothetical protein
LQEEKKFINKVLGLKYQMQANAESKENIHQCS